MWWKQLCIAYCWIMCCMYVCMYNVCVCVCVNYKPLLCANKNFEDGELESFFPILWGNITFAYLIITFFFKFRKRLSILKNKTNRLYYQLQSITNYFFLQFCLLTSFWRIFNNLNDLSFYYFTKVCNMTFYMILMWHAIL